MKANAEEREGESRLKFQRYTLLQASWTELDKMLLEVFEEINNDHEADVMRTQVQIQVGYDKEIQNGENGEDEKVEGGQESDHFPPMKIEKVKELLTLSADL